VAESSEFQRAVEHLDRTDTVVIATPLRAGGERETPIWSVVVDGVPYLRSVDGHDGKWYRRAVGAGTAAFVDGANRYAVTVESVDPADEATATAVDEGYRAKYPNEGSSLTAVITEPARGATLRISAPRAG
jgi:hypothetical protein